ncbi:hemolysin secretion protein D [Bosea sp. WAO]|uniref:HlyD family secretion protein n=1 Tax=Bosea sp. WAO TaxID=406341 RepID=UPI0007491016|nr:efflux RND transporter periplasmic adaptor subunit [Bosea sp. WAO]KUL92703.1 hemolysin secretion protein D [Bosea sp. WAO]
MRFAGLSTATALAVTLLTFGSVAIPVSQDFSVSAPAQAQSRIKEFLQRLRSGNLPSGIAKSNGRIEATQIDVAAKYAGRLSQVLVNEGDDVTAGQVVAKISSPEYEAQLRGAQSQVLKAKQGLAEANALIVQRKSEITLTQAELERGQQLVDKGYLTRQTFDQRVAKADTAKAALVAAEAQRDQAEFAIKSAEAEVDRIEAVLVDMTLVAPRSGRVQYQLARAGEVVGAGSRILTLLDLSDVYMTIYLPAAQAGLLALGDEARITVDPLPNYVIPANVSFVAADAQFTPKSVETADEREKLMFRVKLQIDPRVLKKYHRQAKTGVRGMGFVRTSPSIQWPEDLSVKLP